MQVVLARVETPTHQIVHTSDGSVITDILQATEQDQDRPDASLKEHVPGREIKPHFHSVDQFQVFVAGSGTLGKHQLEPYDIHYTNANTPYGPLRASPETGYSFLTLRTKFDPGKNIMPESRDVLRSITPRHPLQVRHRASFDDSGVTGITDVPEIANADGLFVKTVVLGADQSVEAPDPAHGNGQYVLVVDGSVVHDSQEHPALTVMFTTPDESPFRIQAGAAGLRALVLNFPKRG